MAKDFEEVLEVVGSYGNFQKRLVYIIIIPVGVYLGFSLCILTFQTTLPRKTWCFIDGRENTSYSVEEWKNITIPKTKTGGFERCERYEIVLEDGVYSYTNESAVVGCDKGWDHDRSVFDETVGTEKGWLCEKEYYSSHLLSMTLVGNSIGSILLPSIADRYTGRRLMFYIAMAIHFVFTLLFAFVPNYASMIAVRLFAGLSFQTNYQLSYIIVLELLAADKRALVCFYSFTSWTIGMCFTALIVWIIPHWWYLTFISAMPALMCIGMWRILPESPRWLLSKGRITECCDIMLEIAKSNKKGKKVTREHLEEELKSLCIPEEASLREVLNHSTLLFRSITLLIMFASIYFVYGCLLLNVNVIPSNPFLSFFVLSIFELPSNLLSWISVEYLGRRVSNIYTAALTIIFSFIATFFAGDESSETSMLIIVALTKLFATEGIFVVYMLAGELFPTPIRSIATGTMVVAGMATIAVIPYIIVPSSEPSMQYYIMMGTASVYLLASIPLPETMGLPLPQTFEEANKLGEGRPLTSWINHWNLHKYQQIPLKEKNLRTVD